MLGLGNGNGDGLTPSGGSLKKVVWYKSDFSADLGGWTDPVHDALSLDVIPGTSTSALKFESTGMNEQFILLDGDDYQNPWPQGDVRMGYTITVYATSALGSLRAETEGAAGRQISVPEDTLFEVSSALEDTASSATSISISLTPTSSTVDDAYFSNIEFYYYV